MNRTSKAMASAATWPRFGKGQQFNGLPHRQQGFTLLLGMVLVLIMTVFGVYALNNSILQARMAGNYQDKQVAFEAAEQSLRWGELFLQSRTPNTRPFPCQTIGQDDSAQNCANPRQVLASGLLLDKAGESGDALGERVPFKKSADGDLVLNDGDSYWANAREYGVDPDNPDDGYVDDIWNLADSGSRGDRALSAQPVFLLEQAFVDRDDLAGNPQQGRVFYRVYAAATGERPSTVSILQSSVAKRFE